MKLRLLLPLVVFSLCIASLQANTLKCRFFAYHSIYYCKAQRGTLVDTDQVADITGQHVTGDKKNEDVSHLWIEDKQVNYLPHNLASNFKNLVSIGLRRGHLKVIRQRDLKEFSNLRDLDLAINDIERIDTDTFKFNPNLYRISLRYNKVKYVHPTAFDNLAHLSDLDFSENVCVNIGVMVDDGPGPSEVIKEVKEKCSKDN